jgi:hypothetical protein
LHTPHASSGAPTQQAPADASRDAGDIARTDGVFVLGTNFISGGASVGDPLRAASRMQVGAQGNLRLSDLYTDADFVALSKWVKYRQRSSWSPRIEHRPLPLDEVGATLGGLHALSAPFVPTNLGHVAWDEAFPLLVSMAQLGVYTTELRCARARIRTRTECARRTRPLRTT